MKVFKWFVETIVYKEDTSLEMFGFEVETLNDSKQTVFEIVKYRTNELLKQKGQKAKRTTICWIELKSVQHMSKYQRFVRLYETKRPRKAIMNILKIPFWKLRQFEEYYNENTKPLTKKKYLELKTFLSDEEIRRHHKIPECEFQQFLKGM
ncbi:hypothetical protein [Enterococcus faecalis]